MKALLNHENEDNTKLEKTEEAKVVEAHLHNEDRVTLVYKYVGSFTFRISELKSNERRVWIMKSNKGHKFKCVLNFMRVAAPYFSEGKGDEMKSLICSRLKHFWLHHPKEQTWQGHHDQKGGENQAI